MITYEIIMLVFTIIGMITTGALIYRVLITISYKLYAGYWPKNEYVLEIESLKDEKDRLLTKLTRSEAAHATVKEELRTLEKKITAAALKLARTNE